MEVTELTTEARAVSAVIVINAASFLADISLIASRVLFPTAVDARACSAHSATLPLAAESLVQLSFKLLAPPIIEA